jgi:hypothetical protein
MIGIRGDFQARRMSPNQAAAMSVEQQAGLS